MKGLFKGLRYIARIFEDEKEPEMQIGQPTDVKHVAHIGWEGPSATTPTWMHEYTSPVEESKGSSNKKPASSGERQRHKGRRNKTSTIGTNSSPSAQSPSRVGGSTRQSKRNNGKQREHNNGSGLDSPQQNDRSREPKQSRQRKSKGTTGGGRGVGGEGRYGGESSPPIESSSANPKETDITVRAVYPFASLGSSTGR